MKKSAYAIIVMALSLIGANALASKMDINVKRVAIESQDKTGSDNERSSGGCRSKVGM